MFSYRFGHVLRIGFRSLGAHRLRSGLTALGIVLGVASVIVMLAIGEAARHQALKQLEDLGRVPSSCGASGRRTSRPRSGAWTRPPTA